MLRRGVDWGRGAALPPGAPVVDSDAAAARIVASHLAPGDVDLGEPDTGRRPVLGLTGGDLWRTLGAPPGGRAGRLEGPDAVRVPLDAVRAVLDGTEHWFVAHLVARAAGWRGRFVLAMNAEWLGEWKVAPRAHPGDGLLDVIDGALPLGQRLVARRRARMGDHLPHPALSLRRVATLSVDFPRARSIWLDGRRVGRFRSLRLTVEPAAFIAHL